MYQPLKWIKTSGTHGNGLLQLRPNYEILSLNSLAIQTKRTEIELQETPLGCITSDVDITYLLLILFWIFQHKLSYNLFVFRGIKKLHASQWCFLQFYFRPFCFDLLPCREKFMDEDDRRMYIYNHCSCHVVLSNVDSYFVLQTEVHAIIICTYSTVHDAVAIANKFRK
jgi:hypothetical protein